MLPYKIRKPVGGPNPKQKQAVDANRTESVGANSARAHKDNLPPLFGSKDDDPRIYGGNLQRAILSDLIDLRARFHKLYEESHSQRVRKRQRDSSFNKRQRQRHVEIGSSFTHFKTVFRESRFGCIHNRTVPPRVDRVEYAQLIYSSCFYLLQDALKGKCLESLISDDDAMSTSLHEATSSLENALFAVFALYTLHQTNTLPVDPNSAKRHDNDLQRQWSHLPLGTANEGKIYRRYYKSPVRVDRESYLTVLRLRDVCASIVARCAYNICLENDSLSASLCQCSLAEDGMQIIDRMMHDDNFFSFCEYHGPCGLEAAAGNPLFYNAYYGSDGCVGRNAKKRRKIVTASTSTAPTHASHILTDAKLHSLNPQSSNVSDLLDLSALPYLLEQHTAKIQCIKATLQADRKLSCDLKPRQMELVEKTLSNVWEIRDGIAKPPYANMMDDSVASSKTKEHCPDEQSKSTKELQPLILHESPPKIPAPEETTTDVITPIPVVLPSSFSLNLCNNIRETLSDLNEMVDSIRRTILKRHEDKMPEQQIYKTDGALNDELDAAVGSTMRLTTVGTHCDDHLSEEYDEVSISTGAGKKALAALLSVSVRRNRKQPKNIRQKKNASRRDDNVSAAHDEVSMCTGAGKKALSALLSTAQDYKERATIPQMLDEFWNVDKDEDLLSELESAAEYNSYQLEVGESLSEYGDVKEQAKKYAIEPQQTHKTSKKIDRDIQSGSSEEDSDSSTEVGRNALQSLLSMAVKDKPRNLKAKSPTQSAKKSKPSLPTPRAPSKRTMQMSKKVNDSRFEEDDVSEAGGKKALAALLSHI
jgi:hypothetical protein